MSTKKIQIVGSLVPDVATSGQNGLMSSADKVKLDSIATGATNTVVDDALNDASTNPVQNKVISSKFNEVDAKFAEAKVFVAIYGVTTYQEVINAVNAGRVVQAKNEAGIIHNLAVAAAGEGCVFTQTEGMAVYALILTLDDQWEEGYIELPTADGYYTKDVIDQLLVNKADTTLATTTSQGLMSAEDKKKLNTIAEGATKVIVDSYLSTGSNNAISNAAVTERFMSLTPVMGYTDPSQSDYMSPAAVLSAATSGKTVYMIHQGNIDGLGTVIITFNNASLFYSLDGDGMYVVANQIVPQADGSYVNAQLKGILDETNSTSHWELSSEPIAKQSDVEQALSDYPLIGNTTELTPTQVAEAINAGRPICINHNDATYGLLTINYAGLAVDQQCVLASTIVYYAGNFMICELLGSLVDNQWQVMSTVVAEKTTATSSQDGLMSAADKSKLDGIATNANNYTLPSAGSSLGGVKSGGDVTISDGVITVKDDSHNHVISNIDGLQDALNAKATKDAASQSAAGLMSADDKKKLDGIATGATKITVDSALSSSSANPVQNKAVHAALADKADKNHPHDYIPTSQKGAASGVASLDSNGKVPTSQLPSYVDDVIEATSKSSFPATGETGKIYVDTSTNKTYRWGGSAYVEISASLAIGTTSSTAAAGNHIHSAATTSVAGLMSAADKSKLDGIASGANKYTHPTYTSKTSGLYKITVDGEGHVSGATAVAKSDITALGIPSSDTTYSAATTSAAGLMSASDKSKLDGIASGANAYTHPTYTAKGSGLYKVTIDASGHVSAATSVTKTDITALGIPSSDTTYSAATTSTAGLMSASDKSKLDGIASGATKYSHPTYTSKTSGLYKITVDGTGHVSSATAVAKSDITALGIPSSDTTYSAATTSSAGLMSAADKTKLDGVATGANNYTLPAAGSSLGGVKTGGDVTISDGVITVKDDSHNHVIANVDGLQDALNAKATKDVASQSAPGLMSADDKKKLDSVASGANAYSLPTASASTLGGVKVGTNLSISNGVLSAKDTTYSAATTSAAGLLSATDKSKLDGIATGATKITVDSALSSSSTNPVQNKAVNAALEGKADKSQAIFYIQGGGTTDTTNKVATWTGSHSDITEYYDGLMIAYKVGTAASTTTTLNINNLGAVKVVRNVTTAVSTAYGVHAIVLLTYTTDSSGTSYWKVADYDSDTKTRSSNKADTKMYIIGASSQSTSGQTTYSNSKCYIGADNCLYSDGKKVATADAATADSAGLMSAEDKTKLDGIASGANKTVVDSALSSSSTNPVQNKVVNTALEEKMNATNPVGTGSFSMNRKSGTAIGTRSFAEGHDTTASGNYSHAEGSGTIALGLRSHAEGNSRTESVTLTGAANVKTYTFSSASSIRIGNIINYGDIYAKATSIDTTNKTVTLNKTLSADTALSSAGAKIIYGIAVGLNSHSEGNSTTAGGTDSHAECYNTIASGDNSHAEGSTTIASGSSSHAEGSTTIASGYYSHAEGYGTTAQSKSQHVQGEYNIVDTSDSVGLRGKYAHIVGNGSAEDARSNAHTLDWNGNGWFAGQLKVGGTGQDDTAAKTVATLNDIPENVQSDWNQMDETAPDYVKNRTHYYKVIENPILEETALEFTPDNSYYVAITPSTTLVVGNTYKVVYDDVEYKLTATLDEVNNTVWLGNASIAYGDPISEEPFFIEGFSNQNLAGVYPKEISDVNLDWVTTYTHTISISEYHEDLKKLPEPVIPDEIPRMKDVPHVEGSGKILLARAIEQKRASQQVLLGLNDTLKLESDKTYAVIYDGVTYNTIPVSTQEGYIELGAMWDENTYEYDYSEYPFNIYYDSESLKTYIISSAVGEHTVTIKEGSIHKLDAVFLPDNVLIGESETVIYHETYKFTTTARKVNSSYPIQVDKEYTVVFDGNIYKLTVDYDEDNDEYHIGTLQTNGFYIYGYPGESWQTSVKTYGFHTISISTTIASKMPSSLPAVTASDNGAFLRVVDGTWAAVQLPNVEEGEF